VARRGARSLRAGAGILGLLAFSALAAPYLASDAAWLSRGPRGLRSPVLGRTPMAPGERAIVSAPIPYGPDRTDLDSVLEPPSRRHWLGTDGLGRDVASRLLHGGRVSLVVGVVATGLALLLGLPLGAAAGYAGGALDGAISRLVEAVLCFPVLLLALALLTASPPALRALPDTLLVSAVIGLSSWAPVARYLRGEFLRLKDTEMILLARAAGAGSFRLIARHLLPSALAPVLVVAAFGVGSAVLLEAALSFLGLGVRPPVPSWGGMLTEARFHVDRAWWLALFPGAALFLSVLGCNLLGEGLRDLLDPRRKDG